MRRRGRTQLVSAAAAALALAAPAPGASAATVRISKDTLPPAAPGAHATEVEPDSFAAGSTIVAGFQVGRTYDGGGGAAGWATSTDSGATWAYGVLPGITTATGGTHVRVTDAAVAYDPKRKVWMIVSTALSYPDIRGEAVLVSRSTDGGLTWENPVTVATAVAPADYDKTWITCDGTPSSPHFGNCYVQWDDFKQMDLLKMSTSTDGGKTWGAPKSTADNALGLGGQPVVQPNGTVVVPYASADNPTTAIGAFRSTNGGASWSPHVAAAQVASHNVAGPVRSGPLPSAEVDGAGRVYVVWEDCRFRPACEANDIVMTSSANGVNWYGVKRIPIDPVTSGRDHFVPGLAVDPARSGAGAHLALAYHYMPDANCDETTCQVNIGFVDSLDGGARWSAPTRLAGPMTLSWLPPTTDGFMTGDYISTSFVAGLPHPVFAVGNPPPNSSTLDEAIYAASPPMAGPTPPVKPPPVKPPKRRTLKNLKVRPSRFRATGGAKVTYRASAVGMTRFKVRRSVLRHGKRCGPPRNGRPRTCHVWAHTGGKFKRQDVKGRNSFGFRGRVGRQLGPGAYLLVAEPRDAGRPAGSAAYARFTLLASRPGGRRSAR